MIKIKNIIIIPTIFSIFSSVPKVAATAIEAQPVIQSENKFIVIDKNKNNTMKVLATEDGGFITWGNIQSNTNGLDIKITKYTANDTLVWEKEIYGSLDDTPEKVIESSNGNILVVGYSKSKDGDFVESTGQGIDGFFYTLDSNGNFLNKTIYSGSKIDKITDIIEDGPNEYILGYVYNSDSMFPTIVKSNTNHKNGLVKVDNKGTVLNILEDTASSIYSDTRISGLSKFPDGKYVHYIEDLKQLVISSSELIPISRLLSNQVNLIGLTDMVAINSNNIISLNNTYLGLQKYDISANVTTRYPIVDDSTSYKIYAMKYLEDKSFYLVGSKKSSSGNMQPVVVHMDRKLVPDNIIVFPETSGYFNDVDIKGGNILLSGTSLLENDAFGKGNFSMLYNTNGVKTINTPSLKQNADKLIELYFDNDIDKVNKIEYNLNNVGWVTYNKPFILNSNNSNKFKLLTRAIDSENRISGVTIYTEASSLLHKHGYSSDLTGIFSQVDTLEINLSNNIIEFLGVDGFFEKESENPINLTISSSLPFDIYSKAMNNFVNEAGNEISSENMQIKIGNSEYVDLTTQDKITVQNENHGVDKAYPIMFKLKPTIGTKGGLYKVNLEIKVSQN